MRITTLKYIFLGLALSVVVGLFIWRSEGTGIKIAAANIATTEEMTKDDVNGTEIATTLEKPRYSGRDDQGRQWLITADKATQFGQLDTGTIKLLNVYATYAEENNPDSAALSFRAYEGVYMRASDAPTAHLNTQSDRLTLTQNVIVNGHNLTLKTEKLTTFTTTRSIIGDQPVHLTGLYGNMNIDLTAGAFKVSDNASRIQLTGGLKARLTPKN